MNTDSKLEKTLLSIFTSDINAASLLERGKLIARHEEQDLTASLVIVDGNKKLIVTAGSSSSMIVPADFFALAC